MSGINIVSIIILILTLKEKENIFLIYAFNYDKNRSKFEDISCPISCNQHFEKSKKRRVSLKIGPKW